MLNRRWKNNLRRWAVETTILALALILSPKAYSTIVPNATCMAIQADYLACEGQDDCCGAPYLDCSGGCVYGCYAPTCHLWEFWHDEYAWSCSDCVQYVMCADGTSHWIGNCQANPFHARTGQCC